MTTGIASRGWIASLKAVRSDPVTHVQVAVEGRWEEAARVDAPGGNDSVAKLTRSLPSQGESAVEIFAQDANRCLTFVGIRFVDRARIEVTDFLRDLCEVAFSKGSSLSRVTSWLSASVGTPLFAGECSVVEVGVVDAWKSVGAVRLTSTPGRNALAAEAALLEAAGRVPAPPNSVIAVEFAWSAPVPNWVAVEVGRTGANGELVPSRSLGAAASCFACLLTAPGRQSPTSRVTRR